MNKFLLATLALALATGPVSAQLQWEPVAPVAQKSDLFPQGNIKLTDKVALPMHQTRAGEEEGVPFSAKTLSNMGGWDRRVLMATMQGENGMTLNIATFYDPVLLARFDGNKITKINTVIGPNMKNLKAFIMDAQTGEMLWEGKQLPAINNTTSKAKNVAFKCDYTIDKTKPIVVGYTITTKTSDIQIACVNNIVSNGLLLDIVGDKFEGYQDIGSASGVAAYIDCETEGNAGLKENDVVVVDVVGGRMGTSTEYNTLATFMNYGTNPVAKLTTSYKVGEGEASVSDVSGEQPFPYMAPVQVSVKGMSPAESARYLQDFTVTKVNDVNDEFAEVNQFTGKPDNSAYNLLTAISNPYLRVAVMEEFTGTWCPWCPRGFVGMEKAAKAYPNSFIGIAVHGGDEMAAPEYDPLAAQAMGMTGFPGAMMNRLGYAEPYYGSQYYAPLYEGKEQPDVSGSILNDVKAINQMPVEAKVEISSERKGSAINVTSSMTYSLPAEGQFYSVAYVLLENGVKGYAQKNAYNKDAGVFHSADEIAEEDLRFLFEEGKNGIYMPTFEHVARTIKDLNGIAGSLNDVEIKAGVPVKHTYSLEIPATVKNQDNLEIVALLFDNLTGEIINARKAKIGETTAIENVKAEVADVVVANGAINVKGNGVAAIYTVDGKLVRSASVNGSVSLPTLGLSGVYVVRVVNGGNVTVKKVLL